MAVVEAGHPEATGRRPPPVGLVWCVLLVAGLVHLRLGFNDFNLVVQVFRAQMHFPTNLENLYLYVQLSFFDAVVPILVLVGLWRGWLRMPPLRVVAVAVGLIALVAGHSAVAWLTVEGLQVAWLLKETVKIVAIVVHFVLLLTLFQNQGLRAPPTPVVAVVLAIAVPAVFLDAHYGLNVRTGHAVELACLVFLLAQDGAWESDRTRRRWLALASAAAAVAAFTLFNKGVGGMAIVMMLWILFGKWPKDISLGKVGLIAILLIAAFFAGVLLTDLVGSMLPMLGHVDTLGRSVGVRLELWSLALERLWATFPLGIGLGQFPTSVGTEPGLAVEAHKFVHSTFVGLAADLGLLGLFACTGLLAVLTIAARGWRDIVVPLFVILVALPLLIHDGHSIRMLSVVAALGLARYIYGPKDVARSRGP